MKSDKLLDAMEYINDDKILDAKYGKIRKPVNWSKMVSIAACVLCVVVGSVKGFSYLQNKNAADGESAGTAEGTLDSGVSCEGLPGDTVPSIIYNDKVYYWSGLAEIPHYFGQTANAEAAPNGIETAQLEIEAEFEAKGQICANADYPEVIYVDMTTEWFTNETVRFVTKELGDGERISYQNRQYRMKYSAEEDRIEELPETAELIGTLKFVGKDSIPQKDLETNVQNDSHSMDSMEGRGVFASPEDTSKIYVTIYKHSKDDVRIRYQVCYLWE